jgi:hypothetical protein
MSSHISFSDAVSWVIKAYEVYQSCQNIKSIHADENMSTRQKMVKISANALFVVSQIADAGTHFTPGVSSECRTNTKLLAGAADVGKELAQKGATVDTLATAVFRAADIAGGLAEQEAYMEYKEALLLFSAVKKEPIPRIVKNREFIWNAGQMGFNYVEIMIGALRERLAQRGAEPIPVAEDRAPPQEEVPAALPQPLTAEDIEYFRTEINRFRELIDWENLQELPWGLATDEILRNYICPITQRPIRYVLVVELPDASRIYFEKTAIRSWMREQPDVAPPNWPQELLPLPIRHSYFQNCRRSQNEINRRLKAIAQEAETLLTQLLRDYPVLEEEENKEQEAEAAGN